MIFMKKCKYTVGDLVAAEGDDNKYVFGIIRDIKYNNKTKHYNYYITWSDIGSEDSYYSEGNLQAYKKVLKVVEDTRSMKINYDE